MPLQFQSPNCIVRIFKQGEEYNRENYPVLFNSISSVRAQVRGKGELSNITVEITPAFNDALEILNSGLLGGYAPVDLKPSLQGNGLIGATPKPTTGSVPSSGGSGGGKQVFLPATMPYIAVKFLFAGETDGAGNPAESPWYTGFLIVPDIAIGNGEMTITLHARPNTSILTGLEGVENFNGVTLMEALKKLVAPVGLEVVTDASDASTTTLLNSQMVKGVFNAPKFEIIRQLLLRYDCYYVISDGTEESPKGQLKVMKRSSVATQKVGYEFVKFRNIDPDNDIVPIHDFQMESQRGLFLQGSVFGSYTRSVSTVKKEVSTASVTPESIDGDSITGSESTPGAIPKDTGAASAVGGFSGVSDTSDAEMTGQSVSLYETADANNKDVNESTIKQSGILVRYKLITPGLHKLTPMSVHQLRVGDDIKGLSGTVIVQSFEHVYDSNGWTTEVSCYQTGSGAAASTISNFNVKPMEQKPQAKNTNTKVPKGV